MGSWKLGMHIMYRGRGREGGREGERERERVRVSGRGRVLETYVITA